MSKRSRLRDQLRFFHGPGQGRQVTIAINPFNHQNPMSLRDALKVSALVATSTYILTYFANLTLDQLMTNPALVAFDTLKIWLTAFWGTLITLAGLEKYVHHREEKRQKEG